MPETRLIFFQEADGAVPVKEWLKKLQRKNRRAFARCVGRIQRLAAFGHELRRPHADYLRDGVYELRAREGNVNYRILYFFHGKDVAVLAHGMTKESKIPDADIDRAIERMKQLEQNPQKHTYMEDDDG